MLRALLGWSWPPARHSFHFPGGHAGAEPGLGPVSLLAPTAPGPSPHGFRPQLPLPVPASPPGLSSKCSLRPLLQPRCHLLTPLLPRARTFCACLSPPTLLQPSLGPLIMWVSSHPVPSAPPPIVPGLLPKRVLSKTHPRAFLPKKIPSHIRALARRHTHTQTRSSTHTQPHQYTCTHSQACPHSPHLSLLHTHPGALRLRRCPPATQRLQTWSV